MITFSKDMLEALAGLSGPNDRFQLDEVRSEHGTGTVVDSHPLAVPQSF